MNSLKVKIFLAVIGVLALVAGSVMAYSLRDVRSTMIEAEQRSAGNVLQMAELAIHSQYLQLLSDKVSTIQDRKLEFRQFGQVINSTLQTLSDQAGRNGASDASARADALQWLSRLEPVSGEYIMVFGRDGRAIVYPDEQYIGRDLATLSDIRGRSIVEAAWTDSARYGDTFLTFSGTSLTSSAIEQKYGYFTPFTRWGWMIATVGDVTELQNQTDLRRKELVERLNASMASVQMAGDGFVFIFGADDRLIVPPKSDQSAWLGAPALAELRTMAATRNHEAAFVPLAAAGGEMRMAQVFHLKALNWYVAAVISSAALASPAHHLLANQALFFAAGILLAAIVAWLLAARLSRPLIALTHRAQDLSTTDFTKPAAAGLSPTHHGNDEVGRLATAFSFMETALHQNVQTVMRVTQERERIEGELNVARDIQLGLLPKIFPAFPHRPEIDLYAALVSAKEVGGDLYDFYFVDDRHLCFTIGDVAGKGVPAALFMAITKTLIKSAADRSHNPVEMMRAVNDVLASDNPNAIFVTSLIGILDCKTGWIRYANGGHNPPLVLRANGRVEVLRDISGPALGIVEDVSYDLLETQLHSGETLLLYTDGVTEAMNAEDQLYEDDRLLALMAAQDPFIPAKMLVKSIMADVHIHAGNTPQSDDITLVALRFI